MYLLKSNNKKILYLENSRVVCAAGPARHTIGDLVVCSTDQLYVNGVSALPVEYLPFLPTRRLDGNESGRVSWTRSWPLPPPPTLSNLLRCPVYGTAYRNWIGRYDNFVISSYHSNKYFYLLLLQLQYKFDANFLRGILDFKSPWPPVYGATIADRKRAPIAPRALPPLSRLMLIWKKKIAEFSTMIGNKLDIITSEVSSINRKFAELEESVQFNSDKLAHIELREIPKLQSSIQSEVSNLEKKNHHDWNL